MSEKQKKKSIKEKLEIAIYVLLFEIGFVFGIMGIIEEYKKEQNEANMTQNNISVSDTANKN